jgi:hypothetical protein
VTIVIKLEKEMVYRVRVTGPLGSTMGAPLGEIQYWEMSEAWLEGPRITARAAMPGGDWMRVGTDGYWRPDVRVPLKTDDGAIVLLRYTGLVKPSESFLRAASEGRATEFGDQYLRQLLHFETGHERYRWLAQELFVAEGRLAGSGLIEYDVYRLG